MSNILAVFGATGTQGGSVINNVLSDPELSNKYKPRAITRDANSAKAKALEQRQVEVVTGDASDRTSVERALAGANFVFIMSTPSWGPDAMEAEFNTIKSIADIAVEKGLDYIIFSTLPSCYDMSHGKYTAVTAFDAKAKGEKYIKTLPIKSAFLCAGFFMENFVTQPFLGPIPNGDGTYTLARNAPSTLKLPYVDATDDVGKFVNAILAEPDKYAGQTFYAAAGFYSLAEIATLLGKSSGKTITFKQVSDDEFRSSLPFMGDLFAQGFACQAEYGYFGPGGEEKVDWATQNIRGKLTTLPEYLEKHPFSLET
ncbi:hypothetical protein PV05_06153 [Exophiala xenobiotica]|uniref:NmrA-like domain-containing protein n=1 Tax=Exophiala xenobiotica TaxID=348802 RepID=A0A0D2FC21_9EURO|nr:uncharacterized protein PV05_06153 [Exophiala xenobiotica]KIW57614.1 hypothetical protein PV05_06153 [Exophiala xenobiotica]